MYYYRKLKTEIGELTLIGDGETVEYILFEGHPLPDKFQEDLKHNSGAYSRAVKELKDYFAGKLTRFTFPIKLTADGFNKRALNALAKVGYGKTISYKDLAVRAGSGNAFRAAGTACAQNPLPIVIPCHRVLKSDGSLGGFGGGLAMKRKLLDLENAPYKS